MNKKSQLGQFGENIACKYLVKNGYKIIERNFRQKWGEIDIIAKAPDRTLVFVEVKTIRQYSDSNVKYNNDYYHNNDIDIDKIRPEDQLTKSKLQKLQRTASLYAGHYPELINDEKGWQIDLIALTIKDKSYLIKYYKNI